MTSFFFQDFLQVSTVRTMVFLTALLCLFALLWFMQRKKRGFSSRVLVATALGLLLGLAVQVVSGFPDDPMQVPFVAETTAWYGLFGNGFIDLIRMLVIPLIMVSIVQVIINVQGADLKRLTRLTLIVTMAMVTVAALVGLGLGLLFHLGGTFDPVTGTAQIKDVAPLAQTLRNLLPANPVAAMVDTNIIALVIFSAFFGVAARRMGIKYGDTVRPFYELVNALHKIIVSVAMYVIKLMPYAVVAMLANTIAQRGLRGILQVVVFIGVLYLGVVIMLGIQMLALVLFGLSPLPFVKKSLDAMVMAFTSRSSVGTLPVTISTLTQNLGVSESTANFVASFGSTAGMQGCAGIFPAMLVVFVANLGGSGIDVTFLVMSVIVIVIGSLGIAGIPGTASMAASVALSGTGMAASFPLLSPILAVDPLIDMGRTLINVTGAMVNAIIVDRRMGLLDVSAYYRPLTDTPAETSLDGAVDFGA